MLLQACCLKMFTSQQIHNYKKSLIASWRDCVQGVCLIMRTCCTLCIFLASFFKYYHNLILSMTKQKLAKGQLISEWIYEVILSPKMPTKKFEGFLPCNFIRGRAKILQIFDWHCGRKDDLKTHSEFNWPLITSCLYIPKLLRII